MLLVMDTAGIFHSADSRTGFSDLWEITWERIVCFLPNLREELFKQTVIPGIWHTHSSVIYFVCSRQHKVSGLMWCFDGTRKSTVCPHASFFFFLIQYLVLQQSPCNHCPKQAGLHPLRDLHHLPNCPPQSQSQFLQQRRRSPADLYHPMSPNLPMVKTPSATFQNVFCFKEVIVLHPALTFLPFFMKMKTNNTEPYNAAQMEVLSLSTCKYRHLETFVFTT